MISTTALSSATARLMTVVRCALKTSTATITNSTFYNNIASNRGGALQVDGATATIEFSTFSGNAANAVE